MIIPTASLPLGQSLPQAPPASNRWRRWLRWPGLLGLAALGAGLVLASAPTLRIFWNLVVPILPLSFFIHPSLWRATCPLATLTLTFGRPGGGGPPLPIAPGFTPGPGVSATAQRKAAVGLALLFALVPTRHLVLESRPEALGAALLLLGALAIACGARGAVKEGFCNSICPILPVERLYGQRPLLAHQDARCVPCHRCTPLGCPDLAPETALLEVAGTGLFRPGTLYGGFAAGFPGFILAFGLSSGRPPMGFLEADGTVAAGFAASWLVVGVVARLLRLSSRDLFPALAGICGLIYYWFAAATMARTLGLGETGVLAFRLSAMAVPAWWLATWATGRLGLATVRR